MALLVVEARSMTYSFGALGLMRLPQHTLPKPYVMLQLGAAVEGLP